MSIVNVMAREVAAKIVFYGPGLSGKTTTLRKIHDSVKPEHRGEMMSLPTEADRTLFFDFLPVKVERVGDCSVRLALYTVPGQVFYNATRKLVLQGADGVVFVADSNPTMADANLEALRNLEENLAEQGIEHDKIPLVFQYNKRDLPSAMPLEQMRADLNPRGLPDFETSAPLGKGVLDTLKSITRIVIRDLRGKKVVPGPRTQGPVARVPAMGQAHAEMEDEIQRHLDVTEAPEPEAPAEAWSEPPSDSSMMLERAVDAPLSGRLAMGPASALAPAPLVDYARAADMAFICSDHLAAVRACQEAVRHALSYTGETSPAAAGYLLGVNGLDLLRFAELATRPNVSAEDAAFCLYVVLQVFTRLKASGVMDAE